MHKLKGSADNQHICPGRQVRQMRLDQIELDSKARCIGERERERERCVHTHEHMIKYDKKMIKSSIIISLCLSLSLCLCLCLCLSFSHSPVGLASAGTMSCPKKQWHLLASVGICVWPGLVQKNGMLIKHVYPKMIQHGRLKWLQWEMTMINHVFFFFKGSTHFSDKLK